MAALVTTPAVVVMPRSTASSVDSPRSCASIERNATSSSPNAKVSTKAKTIGALLFSSEFYGMTLKLNIIPLSWCSAMWQ